MAYDEILAGRIAEALRKVEKVKSKKIMGGLCFMVDDKMALGIVGEDLMVRLDPSKKKMFKFVFSRRRVRRVRMHP